MDLYPFQVEGACFLRSKSRALIADQMGLGKSAQVIRALDSIGSTQPFIVCPAIAVEHWKRQFQLWSEHPHFPVIKSYDHLRDHVGHYRREKWDALVVDECQYTKNMAAKRTQAVWSKRGLAWHADRLWAVSGTPAPNHYGELYPMLKAFGAWKGTYYDFTNRYCRVDEMGKIHGSREEHAPELRAILEGYMIRRMKRDVAPDLPSMTVEPYFIESSPKYLAAMPPFNTELSLRDLYSMEGKLRQVLETLTPDEQLQYLASHMTHNATWRRINGMMKVPGVLDLLKFNLENGLMDKVVVYAYHKDVIDTLWHLLQEEGIPVVKVYGGTSPRRRTSAQDKFRKWKKGVFIGQIQAAGTAIDLTSAHYGVMIEKDWVPGNNAQAMERMHRFGQEMPVTILDIVISGSVDEIVSSALRRKTQELTALFD